MFSLLAIASLSLAVAALGWWCKKLLTKVATLEIENEALWVQKEVSKKQLDIASGASLSASALLKRMRKNDL